MKPKSLGIDTYIEEVRPRSLKNLYHKVPTKCILALKAADSLFVRKKTRIENINNFIIGNFETNSLPKYFDIFI